MGRGALLAQTRGLFDEGAGLARASPKPSAVDPRSAEKRARTASTSKATMLTGRFPVGEHHGERVWGSREDPRRQTQSSSL